MIAAVLSLCVVLGQAAEPSGAVQATGFLDRTVKVGDAGVNYVLYVPRDYSPAKAWPFIVFLHGAGERGDNPWMPTEVGIGGAIRRNPDRIPALVLFPQCPRDKFWDVAIPAIEAEMSATRAAYTIDEKRIYLTGISMGGYMTWIWGAEKLDTFAALMPICGGGSLLDVKLMMGLSGQVKFLSMEDRVKRLTKAPIYAFHGLDDDIVPPQRTRQMVDLVKKEGGEVKLREFPGVGHSSWDKAYGAKETWEWLFEQHKP